MNYLPVLGALICEYTAPRLAGFGYLSLACCFYLMLALTEPGPPAALAVLVVGLLARALFRPSQRPAPPGRGWEMLIEALPNLGMLALLQLLPLSPAWRGLAGLQLYLALTALVPGLVSGRLSSEQRAAWEGSRMGVLSLRLGAGASGVLAALAGPSYGLWAFPLVLALHQAARGQSQQAEALLRLQLSRRLERTESHLATTQEALSTTRVELSERVEAFEVLHRLSQRLAEAAQARQGLEALLETAAQLVPAQSLVIFDEALRPLLYRSPYAQKLAGWELGGFREPSVEQAFQSQRPTSLPSTGSPLVGEMALAVPIERFGVLYVGSLRPLAQSQVELVCVLARQTAAALRSLSQLEALREAARREGQLSRHLQEWLGHLANLLESLPALSGTLEPEEQRKRLEQALERLVPHDRRRIYLGGAGDWPLEGTPEAELVERLRGSPAPLLYEDLRGTRLASLGGCLLAFALRAEDDMLGAVLLATDQPGAFRREHQQLMGLLSFQGGMALHNARLHRQVLDAFRQLQDSQAQMIESSKLAAVGQLAAGMAHELNTPLATVLMAVEMAALEGTPQTQANLQLAARQVVRAQSLIEKVLYYSRDARAGKTDVRLAEVAEDTLQLVASDLKGHKIELQRQLSDVPAVPGNANELQQVVLNLLLNARDAVDGQPEPRIRVATEVSGETVALLVQDNGPGIPSAVLERIFDPFFTTKEPGKGTGLGLSISREIAEKHGGQLEVKNTGTGVTARLSLPLGR